MPLLPFHNPDLLEAGCDEAGRGCLAGPVFAPTEKFTVPLPVPLAGLAIVIHVVVVVAVHAHPAGAVTATGDALPPPDVAD